MRDQILNEIRRLSEAAGGKPPGRYIFERQTGISPSVWLGVYWARWSDALIEAGFRANAFQGKTDEQFLLRKFAEAFRHYGKIATEAELRMYGRIDKNFPSHSTPYNRFGSKAKLLDRLGEWVGRSGEFDDVVAILATRVTGSHVQSESDALHKEGFVYLLRSGLHYKIGRSAEIERRVKEIRIALPEAADLVHSIRTDDPAGIEAYWHRRFAERRANGEWFRLTPSDVAAFKRRKYQ